LIPIIPILLLLGNSNCDIKYSGANDSNIKSNGIAASGNVPHKRGLDNDETHIKSYFWG